MTLLNSTERNNMEGRRRRHAEGVFPDDTVADLTGLNTQDIIEALDDLDRPTIQDLECAPLLVRKRLGLECSRSIVPLDPRGMHIETIR